MIHNTDYNSIQGWMHHLGLKSIIEIAAYSIIYGFSKDGKSEFKGSISYIQEWLLCSKPTAIKVMRTLESKGLVYKRQIDVNGVIFNRYSVNLDVVKKFNPLSNNFTTQSNNFTGGSKEILHNIENNIEDNIESRSNSPIINNSPITTPNTPLSPQGEIQKKKKKELDFSNVDPAFGETILQWLEYKRERKQTYTQKGFNVFYKRLIELSGNDPYVARKIVEQSMGNNYQGIFELKQQYGTTVSKPTDAQLLKAAIDQSWGPGGDPFANI